MFTVGVSSPLLYSSPNQHTNRNMGPVSLNFCAVFLLATWSFVAALSWDGTGSSSSGSSGQDQDVVIDALRKRLKETSELIGQARAFSANFQLSLRCSCEDYCTGRCFSIMCSPCSPSTFSFPGGQDLCTAVGPLGTGLLCHVDPSSRNVTENACCSDSGPTCWLPPGSCCAAGDCTTCPTASYPNNLTLLYAPLNREFDNTSSTCYGT